MNNRKLLEANGAIWLVLTTAAGGCLRPNLEHCIFMGGDVACESERQCVAVIESKSDRTLPSNGCVELTYELENDDELDYVLAPYGLLSSVPDEAPSGSDAAEQWSAESIARENSGASGQLLAEECGLNDPTLGAAVSRSQSLRQRLESVNGVRRTAVQLSKNDRLTIEVLNSEVDAMLARCDDDQGPTEPSSTTTTGATTGAGSTTSEGGDSSTTAEPECTDSDQCIDNDPMRPICAQGACVQCELAGSASCLENHPDLPVCVDGACVECSVNDDCIGTRSACDPIENDCVECVSHEDCGDAACNLFTQNCLSPRSVINIPPTTGEEFDLASMIEEREENETTVVFASSELTTHFNTSVTVNAGETIAFVSDGTLAADLPVWRSIAVPQLIVNPGGTVLMDGIRLSENFNSTAIFVAGGQIWIDRSQITLNMSGLQVENGGDARVHNSFIGTTSLTTTFGRPISISGGSSVSVSYSTILNPGAESALKCDFGTGVNGSDSIFLAGLDPAVECYYPLADARFDRCIADAPLNGTDNVPVGELGDWPEWFIGVTTGDFSLSNSGSQLFIDRAEWNTGDPTTDIFGTPRPTIDGTPDFPGAHIP